MWIGVLFLTKAADDAERDTAIVVAYERDRLFSAGGPVSMASQIVRLLREAAGKSGGLQPPRCGECDAPLEVPPLDEREATCVSA